MRAAASIFRSAKRRQSVPKLKHFASFVPQVKQSCGLVNSSAAARAWLDSNNRHQLVEELLGLVVVVVEVVTVAMTVLLLLAMEAGGGMVMPAV